MEITNHPQSRRIGMTDLVAALSKLLRRGLPVSESAAGHVLPNLRSVVARAVHPDDRFSRVDSLNELLTRFIQGLEHDRYGQPARILFGLTPGVAGTNLTQRRAAAADLLGYDPDHFRKRVEPEVVRAVADLVYHDLLRYKKRVTGDTPDPLTAPGISLTGDDFTAEQELVSRVWQHLYGLRAELIAAGQLEGRDGYETAAETHRREAMLQAQRLRELATEYRRTYGPIIRQGQLEYRVEALIDMLVKDSKESGWPPIPLGRSPDS